MTVIKAKRPWAESVPTKTLTIEIEIPVDPRLGLGSGGDDYHLHANVRQCAGALCEAIAEHIYGGPVEWVDSDGDFEGGYRPAAPTAAEQK